MANKILTMEKFLLRFPSTFQFVCPALCTLLMSAWLVIHLFRGTLQLFSGFMFLIMLAVLVRLTIMAYREMREDYEATK